MLEIDEESKMEAKNWIFECRLEMDEESKMEDKAPSAVEVAVTQTGMDGVIFTSTSPK